MAVAYIEPRPKGGRRLADEDYVVESHADEVLATFKTQQQAIAWGQGPGLHASAQPQRQEDSGSVARGLNTH